MANPSVTNSFTNGLTSDAPQLNQNFTDLISALTDGSKDLTINSTILTTQSKSPVFVSTGANPATTGVVRLANMEAIKFRNSTNLADISLAVGSTDSIPSYAAIDLVNISSAQTLTNKTLTTPVIAAITSGSATTTLSTVSTGTGTLAPSSNWAAYTPIFVGLGTVSNVSVFWRREGDSVHVRGSATCGTTTAVATTVSLPTAAATIDSTKVPADQTALLGTLYRAAGLNAIPGLSPGPYVVTCLTGTSTAVIYFSVSTNSATPGFVTVLGNALANSSDRLMFDFLVPVTQFAF